MSNLKDPNEPEIIGLARDTVNSMKSEYIFEPGDIEAILKKYQFQLAELEKANQRNAAAIQHIEQDALNDMQAMIAEDAIEIKALANNVEHLMRVQLGLGEQHKQTLTRLEKVEKLAGIEISMRRDAGNFWTYWLNVLISLVHGNRKPKGK
jgi:hypothetical protein